jgi:hypothetical protein
MICVSVLGLGLANPAAGQPGSKTKKSQSPGQKIILPVLPPKGTVSRPANPKLLPPKDPQKHKEAYKLVTGNSSNWKMDAGQQAALNKLLAAEPLSGAERQQLTDLLFNAQEAGLSRDDEAALGYLISDAAARGTSPQTAESANEQNSGPFYLRVFNKTGERLKVYVQVLPDPSAGQAARPKELQTLIYNLDTGKAYDLQHNKQRVQASAIRVWAVSPTRNWAEHRDHDLVLTTPEDHSATYTLIFAK